MFTGIRDVSGLSGGPADRSFSLIFLWRARRASSLCDVGLEQFGQFVDNFGVLMLDVLFFADVFAEVIELDFGQAEFSGFLRLGVAPSARPGAKFEFPFSAPDREGAVDGMVHRGLPRGLFGLAEEGGQ